MEMTYETFLEKINALSDEEFKEQTERSVSILKEYLEKTSPWECKELILKLGKYTWDMKQFKTEKSFEEFLDSIPKEF